MEAETGAFEAFYAGIWQHPVALWAAALGAYAWARTRRGLSRDVRRYLAALTALSLCDAWLTANHVFGWGSLPPALADAVPLTFVLLGDFRFFLLVTAATADGHLAPRPRAVATAAAWTAVVPVSSQIVMAALPADLRSPRMLFWVYEAAFCVLVLAGIRRLPRVRSDPWLRRVSAFVLVYYGAWVTADSILLTTGSDVGFALRVVPNLLYYGGFIAAVAAFAPHAGAETAPARR